MLPPRSTAGQLTLDQHIGVRIPGGQPIISSIHAAFLDCPVSARVSDVLCVRAVSASGPKCPPETALSATGGPPQFTDTLGYHHLSSAAIVIRTGRKGLWVTFPILPLAPLGSRRVHQRNRFGPAAKSLRPHSPAPCCAPIRSTAYQDRPLGFLQNRLGPCLVGSAGKEASQQRSLS